MIQVQSVSDLIQMKKNEYAALRDKLDFRPGYETPHCPKTIALVHDQLRLVLEEIRFLQEHIEFQARDYTFMFPRTTRENMDCTDRHIPGMDSVVSP